MTKSTEEKRSTGDRERTVFTRGIMMFLYLHPKLYNSGRGKRAHVAKLFGVREETMRGWCKGTATYTIAGWVSQIKRLTMKRVIAQLPENEARKFSLLKTSEEGMPDKVLEPYYVKLRKAGGEHLLTTNKRLYITGTDEDEVSTVDDGNNQNRDNVTSESGMKRRKRLRLGERRNNFRDVVNFMEDLLRKYWIMGSPILRLVLVAAVRSKFGAQNADGSFVHSFGTHYLGQGKKEKTLVAWIRRMIEHEGYSTSGSSIPRSLPIGWEQICRNCIEAARTRLYQRGVQNVIAIEHVFVLNEVQKKAPRERQRARLGQQTSLAIAAVTAAVEDTGKESGDIQTTVKHLDGCSLLLAMDLHKRRIVHPCVAISVTKSGESNENSQASTSNSNDTNANARGVWTEKNNDSLVNLNSDPSQIAVNSSAASNIGNQTSTSAHTSVTSHKYCEDGGGEITVFQQPNDNWISPIAVVAWLRGLRKEYRNLLNIGIVVDDDYPFNDEIVKQYVESTEHQQEREIGPRITMEYVWTKVARICSPGSIDANASLKKHIGATFKQLRIDQLKASLTLDGSSSTLELMEIMQLQQTGRLPEEQLAHHRGKISEQVFAKELAKCIFKYNAGQEVPTSEHHRNVISAFNKCNLNLFDSTRDEFDLHLQEFGTLPSVLGNFLPSYTPLQIGVDVEPNAVAGPPVESVGVSAIASRHSDANPEIAAMQTEW